MFLLKFIEGQFTIQQISLEFYVGVVAILCLSLGSWMGYQWNQKNKLSETHKEEVSPYDQWEQLGISPREEEVLDLIIKGYANQEIADQLHISINTVKTHVSSLLSKFDVRRRTQLIAKVKKDQTIFQEQP